MTAKPKNITELRALAQSMGCKWSFSDNKNTLEQKIALRQTDLLPQPPLPVVAIPDDQRLRTRPPSKVSDAATIKTMLEPYLSLGLHIEFTDTHFTMRFGDKMDSGTLRQPPRVIIDCARKLLERT